MAGLPTLPRAAQGALSWSSPGPTFFRCFSRCVFRGLRTRLLVTEAVSADADASLLAPTAATSFHTHEVGTAHPCAWWPGAGTAHVATHGSPLLGTLQATAHCRRLSVPEDNDETKLARTRAMWTSRLMSHWLPYGKEAGVLPRVRSSCAHSRCHPVHRSVGSVGRSAASGDCAALRDKSRSGGALSIVRGGTHIAVTNAVRVCSLARLPPPAQGPLFQVAWSTRSPLCFAFSPLSALSAHPHSATGVAPVCLCFSLPVGSAFFAGLVLIFSTHSSLVFGGSERQLCCWATRPVPMTHNFH